MYDHAHLVIAFDIVQILFGILAILFIVRIYLIFLILLARSRLYYHLVYLSGLILAIAWIIVLEI